MRGDTSASRTALDPFIPYARFASTMPLPDSLGRPDLLDLIVRELVSPDIERVLPGDGSLRVLTAMSTATAGRRGARARVRALVKEAIEALPTRVAVEVTPAWRGPETLPAPKLAFRALLASRTVALFVEDARALPGYPARGGDRAEAGHGRGAMAGPLDRQPGTAAPR